jgi:hypothetical protein
VRVRTASSRRRHGYDSRDRDDRRSSYDSQDAERIVRRPVLRDEWSQGDVERERRTSPEYRNKHQPAALRGAPWSRLQRGSALTLRR